MKNNRPFLMVSAAAIASAMLVTTAAAVIQYTSSDVGQLQDTLLHRIDVSASHDVNSDGTVNVYDLGLMKKQLSADTGEVVDASYAATAEYVKIQGRHTIEEDVTWLVQSGSAAEFIVTANSASLDLAGNIGITADPDYQPRYAVYVDGELLTDATMAAESLNIPLWEGSSSRTATVKVMLLSEAMYGGIGVQSINVSSSAALPVKPVPENDIRIEFIGDSITCAYGVEGASSSESFKTTTENFSKSYAYLTAQQLGADYSTLCYSGHGIVSGYSSGDKNADSLIPDYYDLASKHYPESWDFSSAPNDVVVINLGTNDINYVTAEPDTRNAEFIEGYIAFLKMVREKNPDAFIICTVGTMGGNDSIYPLIEQAVTQYKEETGDERVMCYESATQNQADGIGSDWHPSPVTQQNSAYVLADKICQALGMESDQIGLDMAADAVYDMVVDTEGGANAAHYVGYDKSFWINTVTGGTEASDIEAVLSGIELREGGEYTFSFDITTSPDAEIPVLIRGTDIYFTETISANSTKTHYEFSFTAPQADTAAEIVFQAGTYDYTNVTLNTIKLVKTK